MNYAGTNDFALVQYKNEYSKIGCNYYIHSDDSYTYIELEGIEDNLPKALNLISELIKSPVLNSEKLDIIIEEEQANRKLERSEPENVANALFDYVKHKGQSEYLNRLPLKEIKKLNTDSLVNTFIDATKYETELHYCGKTNLAELKNILSVHLSIDRPDIESNSPYIKEFEKYNENTIYFVDKKKALQSKIFFFINGKPYQIDEDATTDAFNMYFGGGFSGLVLQEIREYRSMAYSAGAAYKKPIVSKGDSHFLGYIGTQADKTNEAIDVFSGLVRNMPEKSERIQMIQDYLKQSALTSRPDFRNISETVRSWELMGYNDDPTKIKIPQYEDLKFDDILGFYSNNLKGKPMVICIVGDKKRIDMDALKKHGEITIVKESSLFTK
jgi:predicted Zn-dependent peptidase